MRERLYRLVGTTVSFIGTALLLFTIGIDIIIFSGSNNPYNAPTVLFPSEGILASVTLFSFGLILAYTGMLILKKYRRTILFFIKADGPIHSGEPWAKCSESGLFLTSCGFVLSINQVSHATSHFGYKIATAERATCSDCIRKEGRAIMEPVAYGGGEG